MQRSLPHLRCTKVRSQSFCRGIYNVRVLSPQGYHGAVCSLSELVSTSLLVPSPRAPAASRSCSESSASPRKPPSASLMRHTITLPSRLAAARRSTPSSWNLPGKAIYCLNNPKRTVTGACLCSAHTLPRKCGVAAHRLHQSILSARRPSCSVSLLHVVLPTPSIRSQTAYAHAVPPQSSCAKSQHKMICW